ncbi:hypothetical protein GJ744_001535 [Endocarpon pusillum]|uniref:Uncharacterized protein n=1 Tax=Endocarpon pusillum TaxID=364733 RepID=A0A8H7DZF0_9EURO|nr:hypothetical protein GJ744_001535 [Endocarpon pusillum]
MATGASDPRPDAGSVGSLSTHSTPEGSRAPLQSHTTTSPRPHTSGESFAHSSAAFRPYAGTLAESQPVRSATPYENVTGRRAEREAGYLASSRTTPIEASTRALTMHQPSRRTARPQIGHPLTRRTEAAASSLPNIGEASRREPADRTTGVSGSRDGQDGNGSRSAFSLVNTRRDAIETDLHYARADACESNRRASNLQTPLSNLAVPAQRSLTAREYESRPSKICFKTLFATRRGREARESEVVDHYLERIRSHHNNEVPSQHARMRHAYDSLDNWDLLPQMVEQAGAEVLALNSPEYQFYDNDLPSSWRSDVKATWHFLRQHYGFLSRGTFMTETQILVDPKCNLGGFKRISQATIHFEPVLDTILSNHNHSTETTAPAHPPSYWRGGPKMAHKSRHEAILYIENITHLQELLHLRGMLGTADSWSTSIQSNNHSASEVFRNGPQIRTADDLVQWGEFAMSFVEASLSCTLPRLLAFPPDQIGLNRFLRGRGRGTEALYDGRVRLTRMSHGLSSGGAHPP